MKADRSRWGTELALIAAVSLGQSAIYAIVRLVDISTRGPISDAQAKLNTSESIRPLFDLLYQLLGIGFAVVPVALALWFMARDKDTAPSAPSLRTRMGWPGNLRGWLVHILWGAGLFAVIGVGTLGVYFLGRTLGITAQIMPNNLNAYWWTVPVLILHAIKNGVLEEVLLLGYATDRLHKMRISPWVAIISLALFRGSYHLYQGIGPFVGNVLMGLLFGYLYFFGPRSIRGSVMPFVWAHTFIDVVGFTAPGILQAVDA